MKKLFSLFVLAGFLVACQPEVSENQEVEVSYWCTNDFAGIKVSYYLTEEEGRLEEMDLLTDEVTEENFAIDPGKWLELKTFILKNDVFSFKDEYPPTEMVFDDSSCVYTFIVDGEEKSISFPSMNGVIPPKPLEVIIDAIYEVTP